MSHAKSSPAGKGGNGGIVVVTTPTGDVVVVVPGGSGVEVVVVPGGLVVVVEVSGLVVVVVVGGFGIVKKASAVSLHSSRVFLSAQAMMRWRPYVVEGMRNWSLNAPSLIRPSVSGDPETASRKISTAEPVNPLPEAATFVPTGPSVGSSSRPGAATAPLVGISVRASTTVTTKAVRLPVTCAPPSTIHPFRGTDFISAPETLSMTLRWRPLQTAA